MTTIPSNVLHCYFLFHPESLPIDGSGGFRVSFAFLLENMEKVSLLMPCSYLYAFSKNIVHELCRIVYSLYSVYMV